MILTVAVSCLVVGAMIGGTSSPEATTVTKTELKTVHDTKTVTKQVTPATCIETLDVLISTGQATNKAAGKAIMAATYGDAATINAQTRIVAAQTEKIKGIRAEYLDCISKAKGS
jgi:hypothetical protein